MPRVKRRVNDEPTQDTSPSASPEPSVKEEELTQETDDRMPELMSQSSATSNERPRKRGRTETRETRAYDWQHGEIVEDNDHKFQFHLLCDVTTVRDVNDALEYLKSHCPHENFDQLFWAYRIPDVNKNPSRASHTTASSLIYQTYDDDGEKDVGNTILRILFDCAAVNVIAAVSRTKGRKLLGQVRFKHIKEITVEGLYEANVGENDVLEKINDELSGESQPIVESTPNAKSITPRKATPSQTPITPTPPSRQALSPAMINSPIPSSPNFSGPFDPDNPAIGQSGPNCACGVPSIVKESHSAANPDRLYFNCSKKSGFDDGCKFFKWVDTHNVSSSVPPSPMQPSSTANSPSKNQVSSANPVACKRHGQPCVVRVVRKDGPNQGRKFWCCPLNGADACGFAAWKDHVSC